METPYRSIGRLPISYDGSSSEDRYWRHEVNAIGGMDQTAVYGLALTASPPPIDGDGTSHQAPNIRGNRTDGRLSVNSPGSAPARTRNQAGPTRSGECSGHQTPATNLPRPSVTVQNL